jgi:maleylacetate reductase
VLPHAMAYNAAAAPQAMQRIARALGLAEPSQVPGALHDLPTRAGIRLSLKDLGMPEAGIGRTLDLALRQPYPNPRPLERAALRALLEAAFTGRRPD